MFGNIFQIIIFERDSMMTKKESFRNEVLLKMKYQLGKNELAMLDEVLSESLYQKDIVDAVTLPATSIDTNEYILNLYELKKSLTLKESTLKGYMLSAHELIRYVNKPLTIMDREDIEYYLRCKKREGNTGTSLNNKRRKILALFRWMKQQHFIAENPVEEIEQFKEVAKPIEHLLAEEMEQLKEGCVCARDRALLEFLRSTACRRGEIPYIKVKDINWNTGEILIYGEKTDTWRNVYLDSVAIKYLKDYILTDRKIQLNSSEPLFTRSKKPVRVLSKNGIYAEIKRIEKNSHISKRVYPHLFRKTTATNIVRRGGTVDDAGCYIGHKGSDVTRRYYIAQKDPKNVFHRFVESI